MRKGMRTPDIEGVAIHGGPKSCVGDPRGRSEALTGVRAGQLWSREITTSGCLRLPTRRKATPPAALARAARWAPRGLRTCACTESSCARTGRSHARTSRRSLGGPLRERRGGKPGMNECGKSDGRVVPAKPVNKAAGAAAESVEERRPAEGNTASKPRPGHSAGAGAPSALDRVREVARRDKHARFTALLHHVDVDRLRMAYWAIRPQAAPGVDGVTWAAYGQELEANLADLHDRVHAGRYRALPSRRAYIPKADGRSRPLGIATLEDKILQWAVVEVLNAVYEADFLGFSYGFRLGRSPHQALDALSVGIGQKKVNWVLDADIRDFFTSLDHGWLERFLKHRIADRRVLRLVRKWLAAGVIEDGNWSETVEGAPQGASASPLLANVYLHYVFDLWADWWRRRYAHGDVIIVRFAGRLHRGL